MLPPVNPQLPHRLGRFASSIDVDRPCPSSPRESRILLSGTLLAPPYILICLLEFIPFKYTEEDSFRCLGDPNLMFAGKASFSTPKVQNGISMPLLTGALKEFHQNGSHGVCKPLSNPIKNKLNKRQEFKFFIRMIQFDKLILPHNTGTEIELMFEPADPPTSGTIPELLSSDISDSVARANKFLDIAH
ncbi:hypothetical protein JMJ35_010616 [Cladonia borealis]|uniref:Uncharacterized protein n=1 Tax=Cladonia borealis TaxID=184061 RepID=A0AA39QS62_9LECA|nr:hypothetical protein JMJ35_010616 [Cladonia borealis]